MKKVYVMLAAAFIGTAAFAQRSSYEVNATLNGKTVISEDRGPLDTIGGASWANPNAAPTLYGSSNGGFVAGTNGYGDKQKAQAFINGNGPIYVVGAIYWFGAKTYNSGSNNSKVTYKLYKMDGTGTSAAGPGAAAPGTVIASQDVTMATLDTGLTLSLTGTNVWTMSQSYAVASDFAVGFDISNVNSADTVGLVTSTDGDAGGTDEAWEQWSDNTWHSFLDPQNWNLDLDYFILVIVDQNVGVAEYYNGMKLQNTPNPTNGATTINYELESNCDDVVLTIYDMTGRVVTTVNEGSQAAGAHRVDFDATEMAAGQYIMSLTADGKNITKMMTVTE